MTVVFYPPKKEKKSVDEKENEKTLEEFVTVRGARQVRAFIRVRARDRSCPKPGLKYLILFTDKM